MKKSIFIIGIILLPMLCFAQMQTQTSEYEDMPLTGNAVWKINDKTYEIEGTSVIGRCLYAVKVLVNDTPSEKNSNEAKEIAKYAIKNDYYIQAGLNSIAGKQIKLADAIGVAFIQKDSSSMITMGYRFAFSIDELVKEMNFEKMQNKFLETDLNDFLDNYVKYFNSDNFLDIYSSLSEEYKSQISYYSFLASMEKNKSIFNHINSIEYLYFLYLGERSGVKGFNVYIKATILVGDNEKTGYMKILFIEDDNSYKYMGSGWLVPSY